MQKRRRLTTKGSSRGLYETWGTISTISRAHLRNKCGSTLWPGHISNMTSDSLNPNIQLASYSLESDIINHDPFLLWTISVPHNVETFIPFTLPESLLITEVSGGLRRSVCEGLSCQKTVAIRQQVENFAVPSCIAIIALPIIINSRRNFRNPNTSSNRITWSRTYWNTSIIVIWRLAY